MNHLVITADDFGLSEAVNDAVERAHQVGVLTAASLMVGASAASDAVRRARALPGLRVGLHIVLVDGDPVSESAQIPHLLDPRGGFRNDLARYGTQIAASAAARRQVEQEIVAQFEAFRATGLPLDHVNAHRHFHLHPVVAAAILKHGPRYGMRALRVPVEPWRVVSDIDPETRRLVGRITAPWAALLRARTRLAGIAAPDAVFGLAWSGAMTAPRLLRLIERLPNGMVEIYLHPATSGDFRGAAPGYRYAEEFAALTDPTCVAAVQRAGRSRGGFADAPQM